jgi:hypothetical protein
MVRKIELRVHAGAPSSRQSDDRSRRLAEAYQHFTAATTTPLNVHAEGLVLQSTVLGDGLPPEPVTDAETTILHHDETTYVEDTQLAIGALESQILTSSLTVPVITPVKPSSAEPDGSQWPADLPTNSPAKQVAHLESSQSEHADETVTPAHLESRSLGRRRLVPNDFDAPITKPFKLPIKRTILEADAFPIGGRRSSSSEPPSKSQQSEGNVSSYLKTPVLDRSAKRKRLPHHEEPDVALPAIGEASSSRLPAALDRRASEYRDRNVADYRGRTSQTKPDVPYVPLRKEEPPPTTPCKKPAERQSASPSGGGNETNSELPTTYSLSDVTTISPKRQFLRTSQRSTSDPGGANVSTPEEGAPIRRSSSQPPEAAPSGQPVISSPSPGHLKASQRKRNLLCTKQDDAEAGKSPAQVRPLLEDNQIPQNANGAFRPPRPLNAEDEQPPNAKREAADPDQSASADLQNDAAVLAELASLSDSIRPPEPETSVSKFSTHVTDDLLSLEAAEIQYNPVMVARVLRPLERGYWLVNVSKCPPTLQLSCWRYLERYVGRGMAGWGVWCTRDIDEEQLGVQTDNVGNGVDSIKVYCWGEVVKHVYFLLYVATGSKARRLKLKWLDAEEKVVVQMP